MSGPSEMTPVFCPFDFHMLAEGRHYRSYKKLRAHLREVDGARDVQFAVWAPNAERKAGLVVLRSKGEAAA